MSTTEPEVVELAAEVRRFVEEVVIPREPGAFDAHGVREEVRAELQQQAHEAGLLALQADREFGGAGLDMRGRAAILVEAGRSVVGPQALNCAAPDEGNMHLLSRVATPTQKERYLRPLVDGEIRSCFSMTEPAPGAGSDPSMLTTTATPVSGGWRIDGHKWFTSGIEGASFAIVMARTEGGATMFLVDTDNPGVSVVRSIESLDSSGVGGHGEVRFEGCEVPGDAVLGEPDEGFRYAQVRLAPARLTHCMRWLGAAVRAHELALERAREREAFGRPLSEHGLVQGMLADSEIDLRLSRLITWDACAAIDAGGSGRQESSLAKVWVSEAVGRVVDRAVQIHGALGVSEDSILARLYADVRPFRIYDGASEVHRWAIARRLVRAGSAALEHREHDATR